MAQLVVLLNKIKLILPKVTTHQSPMGHGSGVSGSQRQDGAGSSPRVTRPSPLSKPVVDTSLAFLLKYTISAVC